MKYMLLVFHNERNFTELGEATHATMLDESIRLAHELASKGQYLAAPLQPTSTATCVRVRDHKQVVTVCAALDPERYEAITVAGRVPGARIGTVEIRPVRDVPGLPTVR